MVNNERLSECCDAPELGESGFCSQCQDHASFYAICGQGGPARYGCGEPIKGCPHSEGTTSYHLGCVWEVKA